MSLQDGIYFLKGHTPAPCYRLVLINIKPTATRPQVKEALVAVWTMLRDLRQGVVEELRPTKTTDPKKIDIRPGALTCLLGFGAPLFDRYPTMSRPDELARLGDQPFPYLRRVAGPDRRTGEADLALQLIADTDLAVDRALVEVWMLIRAHSLPLDIVTFHAGFNRPDKRSWLGFHDGINNIEQDERGAAIEVARKNPPWMEGGTYMAFLRLAIDLQAWRSLPREQQEIVVGRDKLTGCPLEEVGPGTMPAPLKGCPMFAHAAGSPTYVNPPAPPAGSVLRASHMHRANPNRNTAVLEVDNRIFRQGYEFVEPVADGQLRVGLNFVSFQRNLAAVTNILRLPGWMGNTNFGGVSDSEPGAVRIGAMIAAGFYAVPPNAPELFPGADIF